MHCYLCSRTDFRIRAIRTRDRIDVRVVECETCGLVQTDKTSHIAEGHYEESLMHGQKPPSMEEWLSSCEYDDRRRLESLSRLIEGRRILDFGCGAAGFVNKARAVARSVAGVEVERRIHEYWNGQLDLYTSLDGLGNDFDVITSFHVFEHLADPRGMLQRLAKHLRSNGRFILEVPSSDDALLTLYESEPFQKFTYWSQHLFLFNAATMRLLSEQAGLKVIAIEQVQRYPLANHLYWLSKGLPGGHSTWSFLENQQISRAYAHSLASIGKCDTICAHLEKA